MGLFSKKTFESMDDLLLEQLEDLYDAEMRITKALPKMAEAASTPELSKAFQAHLAETEQHVERLEEVFQKLGKQPSRETCEGIKGLLSEGSEMISADGEPALKDAALIAAAQRVEHYEIAGYGTARAMAEFLGHAEVAEVLQSTLDEEGEADKKLTRIAEGSIYKTKAAKNGRGKAATSSQSAKNARRSSSARSSSRSNSAASKTTKKRKQAGKRSMARA